MRFLELRIPPPLAALAVAGAMWGVAPLISLPALPTTIRQLAALLLAAAGVAITVGGVISFRRAQTTINPLKPETSTFLVSTGIYAVTRNPMYLGMLMVLVAWATYLSSIWALLGPVAFMLYITRFQIVPEERALETLFGTSFAEYKERVRRWL